MPRVDVDSETCCVLSFGDRREVLTREDAERLYCDLGQWLGEWKREHPFASPAGVPRFLDRDSEPGDVHVYRMGKPGVPCPSYVLNPDRPEYATLVTGGPLDTEERKP